MISIYHEVNVPISIYRMYARAANGGTAKNILVTSFKGRRREINRRCHLCGGDSHMRTGGSHSGLRHDQSHSRFVLLLREDAGMFDLRDVSKGGVAPSEAIHDPRAENLFYCSLPHTGMQPSRKDCRRTHMVR